MQRDTVETLPVAPGRCDFCGHQHTKRSRRTGAAARFCSAECRTRSNYLAKVRGAKLYALLERWRHFRGGKDTPGEGALGEIASIMDDFLAEDREHRAAVGGAAWPSAGAVKKKTKARREARERASLVFPALANGALVAYASPGKRRRAIQFGAGSVKAHPEHNYMTRADFEALQASE